jgi:hypothetical protein
MKKPLVGLGIALAFSLSGGPALAAGSSHAEYVKLRGYSVFADRCQVDDEFLFSVEV